MMMNTITATSTLTKERLADGSVLLRCGDAACQMHTLTGGSVLHVCKGVLGIEFAEHVIAHGVEQLRQHKRCTFLVDSWDARMDGQFKDAVASWMSRHKDSLSVQVLTNRPLMAMLVNVAAIFLGPWVHVHADIEQWLKAGRKEVPGFKRRPIV